MKIAKYSTYTVPDFLDDDDFVRFVINPSENDINFWRSVTAMYPAQQEAIDEASKIIRAYRQQDVFTNEGSQQKIWGNIEASLQLQRAPKQKVFRLNTFMRIAAMVLLVSSVAITIWVLNHNTTTVIATAFGEVRTITLPDNSIVILNGNSKLSYVNNWNKKAREVWISGEGFFNVRHINKNPAHIKATERFIVHCNDINIEVLGTSFNVRTRHNKTNVGLISGKIRLEYLDKVSSSNQLLVMKKGDYVEYAQKHVVEQKKLAVPEKLTEWTSHQLLFNNATLAQISEVMTDDYGYHIEIQNPKLGDLKIEGEISVSNVDELLETIATTLSVKITHTDKNITITEN
ncbi:FecR domain-containing protein [Mucilaginibacter sp. BJC16-A38]|uniref:FecR family protein n=1 Tax=Mucilaginibacter phenanthrenivorans TaxID=1234842 RepID=UPI0021572A82|nr:FecR domain-containing protein [Mucilaginibacter phenanthrenivorans]MCR8556608.1 FecR domain-containing protein [Mucilaginibacter phenanthrenivorans]